MNGLVYLFTDFFFFSFGKKDSWLFSGVLKRIFDKSEFEVSIDTKDGYRMQRKINLDRRKRTVILLCGHVKAVVVIREMLFRGFVFLDASFTIPFRFYETR